jgi:IS30 family transposase
MISYEKKYEIFDMWCKNVSKREISRVLGVHRDTITKCIKEFEDNFQQFKESNPNESYNIYDSKDFIINTSKYDTKNRNKRKLTDDLIQLIKIMYSKHNYKTLEEAFISIRDEEWYEKTEDKDGKLIELDPEPVGFSTFCEAVRIALKK